jgi:integrase
MGLFHRTRKKGVVWGISFQWQKEQQQELVGTKAEARRKLTQRLREVREGTYSPEHKTGAVTARMYAKSWGEKRTNKTAGDDRTRLELHFVPYLGAMKLEDIRPRHIIDWVRKLRTGKLSPKAIRNVYGTVRTMFKYAVIDELIPANPCVVPENTLPQPPAKAPGIYEKADIVALTTSPKVADDRRVFYLEAFLTGQRHGEVAGRRWRDIDRNAEPLRALHVRTQYDDQPLKSPDGKPRWRVVPIHPLLWEALEQWRLVGFPRRFGRPPRPDDFIVPSRLGPDKCRTVRRTLMTLVDRDCPAVGVEPLTFHRTRDTFISLCRRGGAPKDVVERITHNAKGDTVDTYTHLDWKPLCAAVLCIELPGMSESMSRLEGGHESPVIGLLDERGGRDSNTSPPDGIGETDAELTGSGGAETGHFSQGLPEDIARHVTGHSGEQHPWWLRQVSP